MKINFGKCVLFEIPEGLRLKVLQNDESRLVLLSCLSVFAIAIFGYSNSFPGAFLFDDIQAILNNELITTFNIKKIFVTDYWGPGFDSGLYRPLTILSYSFNYLFSGNAPFFYHLVNVFLNGIASVCLFLLAGSLGMRVGNAFLAGALFAVHPIHGEAVNIVVGRADLLVAVFTFFALYIDGTSKRFRNQGVTICLVLALLSKENGVALAALVPLADAFRRKSIIASVKERWRFYLWLIAVIIVWRIGCYYMLQNGSGTISYRNVDLADNPLPSYGYFSRFLASCEIQIRYLQMLLIPNKLQLVYGARDLTTGKEGVGALQVLFLLGITALATLGVWAWRRRLVLGWAIPAYAVSTAVTANLFILIVVLIAERFAYLQSGIFCIALASLCPRGMKAIYSKIFVTLFIFYFLWLASITLRQNPNYASELSLCESIKPYASNNGRFWFYVGIANDFAGKYPESEAAYRKGIAVDTNFKINYDELAELLAREAKFGEALSVAAKKIELDPQSVNLTNVVHALALAKMGRFAEASQAQKFLSRFEGLTNEKLYFYLTALIEEHSGAMGRALPLYLKALADIGDSDDLKRISIALLNGNRPGESENVVRRMIKFEPSATNFNLLGTSLALQNKFTDAAAAFREALKQKPTDEHYRSNLERVLQASRQNIFPAQ